MGLGPASQWARHSRMRRTVRAEAPVAGGKKGEGGGKNLPGLSHLKTAQSQGMNDRKDETLA